MNLFLLRLATAVVLAAGLARPQTPLPAGAGKAELEKICQQCHDLRLATGLRQSREQWRNIVQDMVARGARGSPAELDAVTAYLADHFGAAKPADGAAAVMARNFRPGSPPSNKYVSAPRPPVHIDAARQWPVYGHNPGGARYSPLRQITPRNVAGLKRAWTFHTGQPGSECTPVVIDDVMYISATDAIYAIEPETGKIIWKYPSEAVARRGLAYWPGDAQTHPRVYAGVQNGKLIALDATIGKPAPGFAKEGFLDLKQGVLGDLPDARLSLLSPPAVYKDVVITGSNNNEPAPSAGAYGDVRGWDARTGKLLWTFHTVPRPGETGHETWPGDSWKQRSGTNVWGLMTVDVERGLVFLPIGSPTSDYYGADRPGAGLFGNSLVAVDAGTGQLKWFHQLVHHDLWDYDVAAAPALIEIRRDGRTIPAVAQITKMGLLFLFDRVTGEPVYGLEERAVPQSDVPGEKTSPTQPFPVKPTPLARISIRKEEIYHLTGDHAAYCRNLWESNHFFTKGIFTPMPLEGEGDALTFPSTLGGGNWSGVSFDRSLEYAFTNVMNIGQWGHMTKKQDAKTGEFTYQKTSAFGTPVARFWDPNNHIPCQDPPFGELVAVDVNTGDIAWKTPLGTIDELAAQGYPATGSVNLGGSIATASGLIFIGATNDGRFRAFDSKSGKELWTEKIDASAHAVPITYEGRDGKQYVAVSAGGGSYFAGPTSDALIAWTLP